MWHAGTKAEGPPVINFNYRLIYCDVYKWKQRSGKWTALMVSDDCKVRCTGRLVWDLIGQLCSLYPAANFR